MILRSKLSGATPGLRRPPRAPWGLAALRCPAVFALALAATTPAAHAHADEWPTLDDAIDMARRNAAALAEASGQLNASKGLAVGAALPVLNNIGLEVRGLGNTYGRYQGQLQPDNWGVSGTLSLPLEIFGQRGARIDQADALIRWKERSLEQVQAQTMADAVLAYGHARIYAALVRQTRDQEAQARRELDIVQSRARLADATAADMALAEQEVSRYLQLRAEAEVLLISAQSQFAQLIGASEPTRPPEDDTVDPPTPTNDPTRSIDGDAFDRLPPLAVFREEQAYWSASSDRWKAEARQPMSVLVFAEKGPVNEIYYGAGLAFTLPVSRRNQGEIAQAEAEKARAERLAAINRRIVGTRLRSAYDTLTTVRTAVMEIDAHGVPAAERMVLAMQRSYLEGKTELQRVVIARRDLAAIRARRLELVNAAWHAYAQLVALTGQLP
jgi:outer membrane protein, heavy metal efflux system